MRIPRSTLLLIILYILILTDARPRILFISARKKTAEYIKRFSPIEKKNNKNQDGAADVNDIISSNIEKTDYIDIEKRLYNIIKGNNNAAPTIYIIKRKLLPFIINGSAKRDPIL